MKKLERNVGLYIAYGLTAEPLFWGVVLVSYLQKMAQMTLPEVYLVEALIVLGFPILEILFGSMADTVGRKRTMIYGAIFLFLEVLEFALAETIWQACFANALWVVGASLISGADRALIYDSLKALGRTQEFEKIQSQATYGRLFLAAICSVASGHLAAINYRFPVYASLTIMGLHLLIICLFSEPEKSKEEAEKDKSAKAQVKLIIKGAQVVWQNCNLKWIIAFTAATLIIGKVWFFTYNPYFEEVKIPEASWGWIFFAMNLVAALSAWAEPRLITKLGNKASIILMVLIQTIPIIIMGTLVIKICALLVIVQNFVRGYTGPFLDNLLHSQIKSDTRATVDSIKSAVHHLIESVCLLSFAFLLMHFSLGACLLILGICGLLAGIGLIIAYRLIYKT